MGTANSSGTTRRKVRPSPGPEVEIIDSSENGPPAQYANSNATNGARPIRRRFFVGAYSDVGTGGREPDGRDSEPIAPQLRQRGRLETSKTMRAALTSQHVSAGDASRTYINTGCPLYVVLVSSRYPHFSATRIDATFSGAIMHAVRGESKCASPQ